MLNGEAPKRCFVNTVQTSERSGNRQPLYDITTSSQIYDVLTNKRLNRTPRRAPIELEYPIQVVHEYTLPFHCV